MPKTLSILLAFAFACGASSTSTHDTTPDPVVVENDPGDPPVADPVVIEGRRFEGPFADWRAICGEPAEQEGRYERCRTQVASLEGGPFEMIASYHEGDPGSALFALKTSEGWFVPELPDGEPLFGGRSHHTPAGASADAASSRFADGVLKVVVRGSQNSYIPGRGAFGSTSTRWTRVHQCQLGEGVVCDEGEVVWEERCRASEEPPNSGPQTPGPTRTCEETGTDIARVE